MRQTMLDGTEIAVNTKHRINTMTKKINELTQTKKPFPPDLVAELEQLRVESQENTKKLNSLILELDRELSYRRNLGEDI